MPFTDKDMREYQAARQPLYNYCIKLTKNPFDAEDLVQDTLRKAWEKRDHYEDRSNMVGWLVIMARREFLDKKRVKNRLVFSDNVDIISDIKGRTTKPDIFDRMELEEVFNCLHTFSDNSQEALLRIAEGYSYEEAADAMSIQIGTVKSMVSRARKKLAEKLPESVPSARVVSQTSDLMASNSLKEQGLKVPFLHIVQMTSLPRPAQIPLRLYAARPDCAL